jgi:hypothetical protein
MSTPRPPTRQLLLLGAAQAVLFVAGALLGRWLGLSFGFDALAGGYGNNAMIGILFVGLGGGAGAQLARAWYMRKYGAPKT